MNKDKKISKIQMLTKYGVDKQTKCDNFTFLNHNFCREGQTVLFGDSITEIFNVTDFFADYTAETGLAVYNRGISGDTSDRLFERLHPNVIDIKPKNVVILIGTNDLGLKSGLDFTAENVEKIIDELQKFCPETKVILQAIYPVNRKINRMSVGVRNNDDIKAVNAKLKALAERKGIIYVDFTDVLSDENGCFSSAYSYDGLHPNARGYGAVVGRLIELLK
ncbi:MAG: GDSL-type esterase/lipase family protein [Faecalibacterium sp.]|nr:GDSL-type esterase/lipase family protein [Ruminococcus sp.]MCM1391726.1 GDSL-type esterase/lipase family protein [Ruminococcus sp.]MCM1485361.1 GDSL-type esterase/lipase family protein [Faecalibacterium sp.]